MIMTDIQKRIDQLKKRIPDSRVGIMVQMNDGWSASLAGKAAKQFTTEWEAQNYLAHCKTVIVIDV